MVAVAVDPGWREDLGESVQELESREAKGGAAGQIGPRVSGIEVGGVAGVVGRGLLGEPIGVPVPGAHFGVRFLAVPGAGG